MCCHTLCGDTRSGCGEALPGSVRLALRAALGQWRPEGEGGPALRVEAFGEATGRLQVPAPLVRVREGIEIIASIRNDLDTRLRVHGLCARDGTPCVPVDVPPGDTRDVRFRSGAPGTYYYWATTTNMPFSFRGSADSQLSGAFIVDRADAEPDADRVLVITEWTSLTRDQLKDIVAQPDPGAAFLKLRPTVLFAINGLAWPHTERLAYDKGDRVNWRIVNLSTQVHPMHLHGFYFEVQSQGAGTRDEVLAPGRRLRVVTHLMAPGATMGMTWTPERAGNWLFHCHTMLHVSPTLNVDGSARSHEDHGHSDHLGAGMTGLVLGIIVREAEEQTVRAPALQPKARQITLLMQEEPARFGDKPAFGFLLAEGSSLPPPGPVRAPGPPLVLTRGEPVEITLVNRLPEGTAIHWHGMELESYYDGVHGWGGSGQRVTPMIDPGGTFVVRFTPPRAGTFIYHTHLHDNRQLTSGLYGAMLVMEPGEAFDEDVDHVFVIGRGGPALEAPAVINGETAPQVIWEAGTRHRVRLINITPNDIVAVSLRTNAAPVTWHPAAKDGAALPADRSAPGPAAQIIGVGETYDFEYEAPPTRQSLWLEVRSTGGRWLAQGHMIVN